MTASFFGARALVIAEFEMVQADHDVHRDVHIWCYIALILVALSAPRDSGNSESGQLLAQHPLLLG